MNDKLDNQPGRFMGWNERYAGSDYIFGTEPNDFLKSVADQIPDESDVLCLADGEGRNGVYLAKLGHRVTSIDQSSAGLEKAQGLARENKVELTTIQADQIVGLGRRGHFWSLAWEIMRPIEARCANQRTGIELSRRNKTNESSKNNRT